MPFELVCGQRLFRIDERTFIHGKRETSVETLDVGVLRCPDNRQRYPDFVGPCIHGLACDLRAVVHRSGLEGTAETAFTNRDLALDNSLSCSP
jgi:hypothetical protein